MVVGATVDVRVNVDWRAGIVTGVDGDDVTVDCPGCAAVTVARRNISSYVTSPHDLSVDPWPGCEGKWVPAPAAVPVALAALRRLAAVKRPRPRRHLYLEPLHVDLTPAALRDEIAAFCAREAAGSPAAAPSAAPAAFTVLRDIGVGFYSRVVSERFADWQTRVAASSLPAILVASDGSESLGSGGAGAVVLDTTPGRRRLYRFCARVDAGPGILSAYRAEALGALLPLVACWALRDVLPRGPVVALCDNAALVATFAAASSHAPRSSCDLWDEIQAYRRRCVRHFGSYTFEWQRGHPERRKPASAFTIRECCHHLADGLADLGRRGGGAADPSRGSLFSHARRWHVCVAGRRVFDATRSSVLAALAVADWHAYEASRGAPALVPDQVAALSAFVGRVRTVYDRAVSVKYVLAQLSTKRRRHAWGERIDPSPCVICNEAGVPDSLDHQLLDCADVRVVRVRERFLRSLRHSFSQLDAAFADFFDDVLVVDPSGRLRLRLHAALSDAAARRHTLRLVTGRFPPLLLRRLRLCALSLPASSGVSPSILLATFGRVVRRQLWTPVWRLWSS